MTGTSTPTARLGPDIERCLRESQSLKTTKKLVSMMWNATITYCRPTHGTARKKHRTLTVTWQPEEN